MTKQEALLALQQIEGIGPVHLRRLLEYFHYEPQRIWQASLDRLGQVPGMGTRWIAGMSKVDWQAAQAECLACGEQNISLLCYHDGGYPSLLLPLADPPVLLYTAGSLLPQDDLAIAIVGTRQATSYGRRLAYTLAKELAKHGITVVSGLARGIDGAAHAGALAGGGRTIAVLGHGLNIIYPADHRELSEQIKESGALVSEFSLATEPAAYFFPRRNRIISGLSLGVIVVEGKNDSGALITADCALEQGREVFATPGEIGRPQSEGPHTLIQQGAKLVTNIDDVLEEIPALAERLRASASGTGATDDDCFASGQASETTPAVFATPEVKNAPISTVTPVKQPVRLSNDEHKIWQVLTPEPQPVELIVQKSNLTVAVVNSCLLQMEIRCLAKMFPGQGYGRLE
jgi:DNA processing protein